MKNLKKFATLCLCGLMMFSITACNSNKEPEKETTKEESKKELKIKEETLKEVALNFGTAVFNKDYKTAMELCNVKDRTFITDKDFEEHLDKTDYLSGLLHFNNLDKLKESINEAYYSTEYTEHKNEACLVLEESGVYLYGYQIDKETCVINMSDFFLTDWRVRVPENATLVIDDVDCSKYMAPEEMQVQGTKTYLLPIVGNESTKQFKLTINNETKEGTFVVKNIPDTILNLTENGEVKFETPSGLLTEKELNTVLKTQEENSKYQVPNDATISTDGEGNMIVLESDGTKVILDENGSVVSRIETNNVEPKK